MKILILSLSLVCLMGCETYKCASIDFHNFRRTIEFNLEQPVVYKSATF